MPLGMSSLPRRGHSVPDAESHDAASLRLRHHLSSAYFQIDDMPRDRAAWRLFRIICHTRSLRRLENIRGASWRNKW